MSDRPVPHCWLLVARPCVRQFSGDKLLKSKWVAHLATGWLLHGALLLLLLVQVFCSAAYWVYPRTPVKSVQWEHDVSHEAQLVLPHQVVTVIYFLAGWTFVALLAHLANREVYFEQLLTFDALYVLLNFFAVVILKHVCIFSLYWDEAAEGEDQWWWYWQVLAEDCGSLAVVLVVTSLDSAAFPRRWKVATFGVAWAASLLAYSRTYTEACSFSEFGVCAFGVKCNDYVHYYRTALLNTVIFIAKMGWPYLTTDAEVGNIRPRSRVTFHPVNDPEVEQLTRLGTLLDTGGPLEVTKKSVAVGDDMSWYPTGLESVGASTTVSAGETLFRVPSVCGESEEMCKATETCDLGTCLEHQRESSSSTRTTDSSTVEGGTPPEFNSPGSHDGELAVPDGVSPRRTRVTFSSAVDVSAVPPRKAEPATLDSAAVTLICDSDDDDNGYMLDMMRANDDATVQDCMAGHARRRAATAPASSGRNRRQTPEIDEFGARLSFKEVLRRSAATAPRPLLMSTPAATRRSDTKGHGEHGDAALVAEVASLRELLKDARVAAATAESEAEDLVRRLGSCAMSKSLCQKRLGEALAERDEYMNLYWHALHELSADAARSTSGHVEGRPAAKTESVSTWD